MPVSTRSQIIDHSQTEPTPGRRTRPRPDPEDTHLRNHHHGLKEKLKNLTLLYEQQKQASMGLKNQSFPPENRRFSANPTVELPKSSNVMKENTLPNSTITRTYVLPTPLIDDSKENVVVDKIVGFSCPKKAIARKLSLGGNRNVVEREMESGAEKGSLGCGGSRILVFVRLRPMSKKERDAGSRSCIRIVNQKEIYLTEFATDNDYLRLNRVRGRHFTFDTSFPDSSNQHEVYSTTTAELVEAVLQGRNGSVFCYGATGAGKTYTMLGTMENPGVMVLAIKDLFTKIRQRSCDGNHVVHLSYLEVYNEMVRDLLSPGRPLVLREDKQGIMAAGLTQYRAYSTDEVMALLQQGNKNRTTEPTRANETSSRSHAILQVMVEYCVRDESMNVVKRVGKLSLIDLAGSERALATDQRTLRSIEGANINRSLLALSSCINALVEDKKHIPYRNSKLTQLLKDSLGGLCNTVMIANISPSNLTFGETQNTLHWADRAKEIRTKACDTNEDIIELTDFGTDQTKLLLELQKENSELRVLLARQQQTLLTLQAQALAAKASPTPSSVTSFMSTPPTGLQPNLKRKPRPSFLSRNCFTPESKQKVAAAEETVVIKELRLNVKALEAEIERMKKQHALQIKQKDNFIHDLSRKSGKPSGGEESKRMVTRSSLRPKEPPGGELKSPSHRFMSPAPTAKKRSYWDIATANSPSVTAQTGRKIRSHVASQTPAAAPSMLLQALLDDKQVYERAAVTGKEGWNRRYKGGSCAKKKRLHAFTPTVSAPTALPKDKYWKKKA